MTALGRPREHRTGRPPGFAYRWGGAVASLILFQLAVPLRAANQGPSLAFPPEAIVKWEAHAFDGRTRYALDTRAGRDAVHARCEEGASGLFLRRRIDLRETPILEWRWLVPPPPDGPAEDTRAGDDFSARIYVVDEHSLLPWRTRALNYVWTRSRPAGSDWPNPFAGQAHMVAMESGDGGGQWVTERRDVRADFRRYHGREVTWIDAVAIMTDCDNTGLPREAWYGTIRLLAD